MLWPDRFDCITLPIVARRMAFVALAVPSALVTMMPRTASAIDDAAETYVEAPAVAARFPDPVAPIATMVGALNIDTGKGM